MRGEKGGRMSILCLERIIFIAGFVVGGIHEYSWLLVEFMRIVCNGV